MGATGVPASWPSLWAGHGRAAGDLQEGGLGDIELAQPRRIDVLVEPGRQSPAIVGAELLQELMVRHCLLDEERVDQHETVLYQLKAEGRDFLLLAAIGGKEALAAIANKVISFIPPFHHVQARFNLVTECQRG